jgi:hypothetical protein
MLQCRPRGHRSTARWNVAHALDVVEQLFLSLPIGAGATS